jgi:hypothetical protein
MKHEYLIGWKNYLIRVYFYLTNGLSLVNDFRNLGLGIFALYITLKLTNPWWLLGMAAISVIILTPTGYFMVHKVSKVKEWLSTKFGSHYAIQNFDYVKAQYEALERIEKLLIAQNQQISMPMFEPKQLDNI